MLFSKATGGRAGTGKASSVPSCSSAAKLEKQFQAIGGVQRQKYLKNRNGKKTPQRTRVFHYSSGDSELECLGLAGRRH